MNKKAIIWLLVSVIAIVVIGVGVTSFIRGRNTRGPNACANNLRQFESAKEQWANENKKAASLFIKQRFAAD